MNLNMPCNPRTEEQCLAMPAHKTIIVFDIGLSLSIEHLCLHYIYGHVEQPLRTQHLDIIVQHCYLITILDAFERRVMTQRVEIMQ